MMWSTGRKWLRDMITWLSVIIKYLHLLSLPKDAHTPREALNVTLCLSSLI